MLKLTLLAFAILFIKLCFCDSVFQTEESDSQNVLQHSLYQSDCRVNLCFVLDGSSSINLTEFRQQITMSLDILAELSHAPIGVVATQYGSQNYPISPYTTDENAFFKVFRDAKPRGGLSRRDLSAVSDGIVYCEQQLRSRRNNANVIIVMNDGSYNRGFHPGRLANLIKREVGNYLFLAVKVESPEFNRLLKDIGGEHVFEINVNDTVKALVAVEEHKEKVCN